jgi:hypothetical protein
MQGRPSYPDIAAILAQKERGRRERAALSFAEKLDALERLKENVAPIIAARKLRTAEPGRQALRGSPSTR